MRCYVVACLCIGGGVARVALMRCQSSEGIYIGIDGKWMGDTITDDGCIGYGSLMVVIAQEVSLVAMLKQR